MGVVTALAGRPVTAPPPRPAVRRAVTLLLALAAAAQHEPALPAGARAHDAPAAPSRAVIEQKIELVERLLQTGPRAGGPAAAEALSATRGLTVDARDALDAGDDRRAAELADRALLTLSRSRRRAREGQARSEERALARYEQLHVAIAGYRTALASALEASDPATGYDLDALDDALARAARLAGAGHLREAGDTLARAYEATITALAELTREQTVVHALAFESVEAELRYERERLRGSTLLLEMLLARSAPSAGTLELIERYRSGADAHRELAHTLVAGGNVAGALLAVEEANRHVGRALALLGVATGY